MRGREKGTSQRQWQREAERGEGKASSIKRGARGGSGVGGGEWRAERNKPGTSTHPGCQRRGAKCRYLSLSSVIPSAGALFFTLRDSTEKKIIKEIVYTCLYPCLLSICTKTSGICTLIEWIKNFRFSAWTTLGTSEEEDVCWEGFFEEIFRCCSEDEDRYMLQRMNVEVFFKERINQYRKAYTLRA